MSLQPRGPKSGCTSISTKHCWEMFPLKILGVAIQDGLFDFRTGQEFQKVQKMLERDKVFKKCVL